jgi:hypothetical protein
MKFPTRFPTIIGLFFAVCVVGIIIFVTESLRSPTNASPAQAPDNIRKTNISDASFTISWTTGSPATGTILLSGVNKKNQMYFDERDQTGKLGKYITHSITIRDALPDTEYTYKILSGGSQYVNDGVPFTLKTAGKSPPNTGGLEPAYGTILSDTGAPAEGALVYLSIDGAQDLSALTKSSGLWLIPLNQVRTPDLAGYAPATERMTERIHAQYGDFQSTAITDTLNDSPVPEMYLGKSYDFRRLQANAPVPSAKTIAQSTTTPGVVLGQSTIASFTVSLTQPKEGASLTSAFPLIAGTGIPGAYVGISLGLYEPVSGTAKADENGLWKYTPTARLGSGKQSVTILTKDSAGKPVAITHAFTILKSGTQVLGSATPSATIVPTENPAESPTMTPVPTETPVQEATLTAQVPPASGFSLPTTILLLIGVGLFFGGAVVFIR